MQSHCFGCKILKKKKKKKKNGQSRRKELGKSQKYQHVAGSQSKI